MDVRKNIVVFNAEETESVFNLMCTCGHPFREHEHSEMYNYPVLHSVTSVASSCPSCAANETFACEKFELATLEKTR